MPTIPEPIKALANKTLGAAAHKFVDFLVRKYTGKSVEAFKAEGEVEANKIRTSWEEVEKPLWLQMETVRLQRQYENFREIIEKSAPHIIADANQIENDNDFFWGLIEHAKDVSNVEMQELISKILAGEYNAPGTYSMSTLQILKSLGKTDLEVFSTYGTLYINRIGFIRAVFSMNEPELELRKALNLDYPDFLELQNLGLIQSGSLTGNFKFSSLSSLEFSYGNKQFKMSIDSGEEKWRIPPCYELTKAGKEILPFLKIQTHPLFEEWLCEFFIKEGFTVH